MKLLSRFIWLIIGISIVVFAGISLAQYSAEKKFEEIKQSISQEYNLLAGKMLKTDKASLFTYNQEVCNSSTTRFFLAEQQPNPDMLQMDLDTSVLNYFNADGVWFFKPDGSLFYFKANKILNQGLVSISKDKILEMFKGSNSPDFYLNDNNIFYRVIGAKVGDINSPSGYILTASAQNNRWIGYYEKELNNSVITFINSDQKIDEVPKDIIQLELPLKDNANQSVGKLMVTLKLPFLALWKDANTTDNFLMIGALVVILFFLIVFLTIWVVLPLRKISGSLKKSSSQEIEPLLKSSTELGEVARMINDYHKKKDELEASEGVKRHIIEQAQVGIIIADKLSKVIVTANPYACNLINATEDAVVGNILPNFLPNTIEAQTADTKGQENFLINALGQEIPVLRTSSAIFIDGKPVVMETFVDLTEIKTLRDKLEEEKKKLSLAVQNSGLIFCEYDFKSNEITIDKSFEFLAGGSSKSVAENVIGNIYSNDVKIVTDKFEAVRLGLKDTLIAEFRVKHPTRGLIWLSASVLITKRDENNQPRNLIGLLQDITERIAIQQELIKAKEKAEESDRMKSSYLGNMSHKIRTPLNAIVGFANLISEEELEQEERNNFINIIRRDTEQVLHLIDDIINIAKIESNQMGVTEKSFSINQMIDSMADYYKVHEKTDKIKLNVKTMLPNGKDVIITDAEKLQQAYGNLVNNAFKFTKEGSVELGYYINPVEKKMIIYVKDSGIGIPDDSKDKIFTHYYQVNQMSEGTGLGLTISKSMINLLGGKIYFDSKLNEGSTFYIEIPFNEQQL